MPQPGCWTQFLGSLCRAIWPLGIVIALGAGAANASPADTCDHAAQKVSKQLAVPLDVLRALTRTETGRGSGGDGTALQPWPWTVNMEGQSVWFDTEAQAQAYVFRHFRRGARSFDIGCFQINYRWHGHAFRAIEEMFDPNANAAYAARFLQELYAEFGDWTRAVGAYHSRTEKYATRYLDRYARIHRSLPDQGLVETAGAVRANAFPLLSRSEGAGTRGSLVPLSTGARQSLLPRPQGARP